MFLKKEKYLGCPLLKLCHVLAAIIDSNRHNKTPKNINMAQIKDKSHNVFNYNWHSGFKEKD